MWVTNSHDTFCIDALNYEFPKQKMNSQKIRKLPGTKKEFPFIKSKIDNRKTVPAQSAKADVAPLVTNKVGFGYQGFGSTSITAAIPKHEIIRPLADHRDKNIHPRDWNSSSKPELIKEKAVAEPKPFKATDPFLAIITTCLCQPCPLR